MFAGTAGAAAGPRSRSAVVRQIRESNDSMRAMRGYAYNLPWFSELCDRARAESRSDPRNAMTAVLLAAIWVEAFFNDFLHIICTNPAPHSAPTIERLRRLSTAAELDGRTEPLMRRVRVVGTVLTDEPIDVGAAPWQELAILLTLRNALVHSRPEPIDLEIIERT